MSQRTDTFRADRRRQYAWLSITAALLTIGLKTAAFTITRSIGLLSDALESTVNLVAAVIALVAIIKAAAPPDEEHPYGHFKAEYFSSGVEGALIVMAALTIAVSAIDRWRNPVPLAQLDVGVVISAVALLVNLLVARVLARAGRELRSIALRADAAHLMTDVWTSVGVLAGIGALAVTGWQWLDLAIALAVAVQISWSGVRLVSQSMLGLMDTALPPAELAQLEAVIQAHVGPSVTYHALRTRQSGSLRFASFHLQVPGDWSVSAGHALIEEIEDDIRAELSPISILIHLEPLDDPASHADLPLYREH